MFVDGRSDYYGAAFDNTLLDLVNAQYKWESSLSDYTVDTVLLRANAPLAGVLKESHNWSVVYDDGLAIVFRARRTKPPEVSREKISSAPLDGKKRFAALSAGKPEQSTLDSKPLERRIS